MWLVIGLVLMITSVHSTKFTDEEKRTLSASSKSGDTYAAETLTWTEPGTGKKICITARNVTSSKQISGNTHFVVNFNKTYKFSTPDDANRYTLNGKVFAEVIDFRIAVRLNNDANKNTRSRDIRYGPIMGKDYIGFSWTEVSEGPWGNYKDASIFDVKSFKTIDDSENETCMELKDGSKFIFSTDKFETGTHKTVSEWQKYLPSSRIYKVSGKKSNDQTKTRSRATSCHSNTRNRKHKRNTKRRKSMSY